MEVARLAQECVVCVLFVCFCLRACAALLYVILLFCLSLRLLCLLLLHVTNHSYHAIIAYFEGHAIGLLGDGGFSFNPAYENIEIAGFTPVKKKAGQKSLPPTEKLFNYTVRSFGCGACVCSVHFPHVFVKFIFVIFLNFHQISYSVPSRRSFTRFLSVH